MIVDKKILVRKIEIQDIESIVEMHLKSFEGFFLTFMGCKFLQVLYKAICKDPTGFGFLVEVDNKTAGFVIGTSHLSGLYSRLLKKNMIEFGLASISAILKKPSIIIHLLRTFAFTKQQNSTKDLATLMSIAIDPEYQGNNIGAILVDEFLKEASKRDCKKVNLNTDAINNDKVNYFYQKLGFSLHQTFTTHEGRMMNEYRVSIQ
ncbi:MAG: GNAT family N-acetyltransferase [Anaerolineaceae bacterium]|nr:GNAT family N-acetyltransferase [Anaerolineaceae bacterium]